MNERKGKRNVWRCKEISRTPEVLGGESVKMKGMCKGQGITSQSCPVLATLGSVQSFKPCLPHPRAKSVAGES
jgi:hypothetical protein